MLPNRSWVKTKNLEKRDRRTLRQKAGRNIYMRQHGRKTRQEESFLGGLL